MLLTQLSKTIWIAFQNPTACRGCVLKRLKLNDDGSSTLSFDELLREFPDCYTLLCAVISSRAAPSLAGLVAERDPEAGRKFIKQLDLIYCLEHRLAIRELNELYRAPVLSSIARAKAHEILKELE